jgi:hypothetical protein
MPRRAGQVLEDLGEPVPSQARNAAARGGRLRSSATRSDSYLAILLRTSANERARGSRDVPGRRASDGALSGCDALALTRQRFVRPTRRRPAPLLRR